MPIPVYQQPTSAAPSNKRVNQLSLAPQTGTMQQQFGTMQLGDIQSPRTTTQQQSPALAAMAGSGAVGKATPTATMTNAATAKANPQAQTGSANPDPRTDLATATQVDTSGQNQIYKDQLAASDKAWDYMQANNANTMSALQRRNASNAALSGFSVGGGSYLAGQRQAAVAGINASNQAAMNWLNQRTGIMGQAAGLASNAASQNAAAANNTSQFNAGREGAVQDRTAGAEATNLGNKTTTDLGAAQTLLKNSYGIDLAGGHGATWALGRQLSDAVSTAAAGSPEQAAAMEKFQAYQGKLAQAKSQYNALSKDVRDQLTFDAYLKKLEQQGYFNV